MRLLMPIDGSSFSKTAVAFIASRATLIQNEPDVELLNVQYHVPSRAARALGKEIVLSYYKSEADKVVKPALAKLRRAGLHAQAKYVVGLPGAELGKIVASDTADLIVMGSHGHTGFKKLLFGSVTNAVLASCTTPLLVLRGKPAPKKDSLQVAIALDGSKYGVAAVRYFIKNRDLFGAAPMVTLIHVVPNLLNLVVPGFFGRAPAPGLKPEQAEAMQSAAFENAMAPARKLLEGTGLSAAEVCLVGNNVGDEIAAYTKKSKLDLLALGSHGYGALESAVLGSVATRVAAQCQVALLLVREK